MPIEESVQIEVPPGSHQEADSNIPYRDVVSTSSPAQNRAGNIAPDSDNMLAKPALKIAPHTDTMLTKLADEMAEISMSFIEQWNALAETQAEEIQRQLQGTLDLRTTQALSTLERASTDALSSIDMASTSVLSSIDRSSADTVARSVEQIEQEKSRILAETKEISAQTLQEIEQQKSRTLAETAEQAAQALQQIEQLRLRATAQIDAETTRQVAQSHQQIEQQRAETLDLLAQRVAQIDRHRDGAIGQISSDADAIRQALAEEKKRLLAEIQQQLVDTHTRWDRYFGSALQTLGERLNSACSQLQAKASELQAELDRHREMVVAHAEAVTQEVNTHKNVLLDVRRVSQESAEQVATLQQQTLDARDQTISSVQEIQNTIKGITDLYGQIRATASQNALVVRQVHDLAEQAQQGKQVVVEEIEKVQQQFDRIIRLDRIMSALDGAVNKIYATTSPAGHSPAPIASAPVASPDPSPTTSAAQSPTISTSPTQPPAADLHLPESLTPGTSAFSFLARFTQFVNIQWADVLTAVAKNEPRFFTNRRLQDLDLILYGDIHALLKASGEPLSEELATELELARTQYRQQLTDAGMVRIEGKPGDHVKPYWLEADQNESVHTTDPALDGTYANIVPGNAGYLLAQRAIKPTLARFYKYVIAE